MENTENLEIRYVEGTDEDYVKFIKSSKSRELVVIDGKQRWVITQSKWWKPWAKQQIIYRPSSAKPNE